MPLCQEKNPEDLTSVQDAPINLLWLPISKLVMSTKRRLRTFDELLSDFEEDDEEEVVDWSRTTFTMDDVTIDVKQYGKDDSVVTKQKPSFAMTVDTPEPIVEEAEEEE